MDNNYKWIRLLTLNGWVSLNTESIESTDRVNPTAVRIITSSGRTDWGFAMVGLQSTNVELKTKR